MNAGDVVELALERGTWACVRFEWQHMPDGATLGYFTLGLADGRGVPLILPDSACARWPA